MLDEQENHASREEEEDVLGERVRCGDVPRGVDDRCDDEQRQRGPNRIPPVEAGPDRVDEINEEKTDKDLGVRYVHRSGAGSGQGV
jgi:hypothetical protein